MVEGNLTTYIVKFNKLYSELLEKGKDLYLLGMNPLWVVGLDKKERMPIEDIRSKLGYLKLLPEDVNELERIFPGRKLDKEFLENYGLRPYTENGKGQFLGLNGLESILNGKSVKIYESDRDVD